MAKAAKPAPVRKRNITIAMLAQETVELRRLHDEMDGSRSAANRKKEARAQIPNWQLDHMYALSNALAGDTGATAAATARGGASPPSASGTDPRWLPCTRIADARRSLVSRKGRDCTKIAGLLVRFPGGIDIRLHAEDLEFV
jgi:hypothetical protein